MVKPQQPELRRSDRGATSEDATKERLTAPSSPRVDGGAGGPIPVDNLPGHHPDHEQDKPSGRDFVAKTHALAHEDEWEAPSMDNEVIDLTQVEQPAHVATAERPAAPSLPERLHPLAQLAGLPFAVAGRVLTEVRNRLP